MKIVDKLVLKDIVPWFFIGVGMFTALYFALGSFIAASRFLSQGVPPILIAQWMFYNVVPVLGQTFPMGMLLAVLLGFGRLSGDSEAVALFAGGISFQRVALTAAMMGLVVSLFGWVLYDPVASFASAQADRIRTEAIDKPGDIKQTLNVDFSQKDMITNVRVDRGYDARTHSLRDVTLTLYDQKHRPTDIIHAERAQAVKLTGKDWILENADIYHLGPATLYSHLGQVNSKDLPTTALEHSPDIYALLQSSPDKFSSSVLRRNIAMAKQQGLGANRNVRDWEFNRWGRIAVPLASLIFAVVGAPLGLRPQRSAKLTGMIVALPIILGYYVLYTVMENLTMGGRCAPILGAFLPDLVGLALGIWLVWRRAG